MKTFNKTELKAARTILKEVLKKGRFVWNDKHVATVTVKALDMLIINGYGTGGLKFSSLTEDEQDLTRIISFNRGYNGVRFSRDDLFFVETRADMDDFGFDNGAITKLVVALFKTEVLPWYESQYHPNSDHHFDCIDSCNIFGWYSNGTLTVQNGKGRKITITDAKNKTTMKTYSSGRNSNALWFMEGDDNFITSAAELRETFRDGCSESAIGDFSASSDVMNLTAEFETAVPTFSTPEKNQ